MNNKEEALCHMSNQDPHLNDVMPADEQAEIFRDGLLGHHYALMKQISAQLEMAKSSPGAMTPEVVTFFEQALAAERHWLESRGIYFPDSTAVEEGE
ncbi:hypothetical protein [Arthrobacter sp. 92]|uniref:hypothetical protein n=1 Tax=Arthrobacter sp. 92 TaxID=3418175 RepID=UPI003CFF866C